MERLPAVVGSQMRFIGPANCTGVPHVAPPFMDEIDPAKSWHVENVQLTVGK